MVIDCEGIEYRKELDSAADGTTENIIGAFQNCCFDFGRLRSPTEAILSCNKNTKFYDSINAQQTNYFKNKFIAHRIGLNFKYSKNEKFYFQAGGLQALIMAFGECIQ